MSFNYTSPSGITLTAAEEQLLESIDKFNYPLIGYANLAGLDSSISVVLMDKTDPRPFRYTMTNQQWNEIMSSLEKKVNDLRKQHDNKRDEALEKQRIGEDSEKLWDEKNQLEILLGLWSGQKYFYEQNTMHLNGVCRIEGESSVLGEYDHANKRVILYYDTIKQANPYDDENRMNCLFAVVYVHEMMHAYLDNGNNTIKEIEEPIVESAMLDFFQNYDKDIFEFAKQYVEAKQAKSGLAHYGFGYCIFKNPNNVDWLEDYRKIKSNLIETSPDVATYLDYWKTGIYPEKKEKECLEAMYKALHGGAAKQMKTISKSSKKPGLIEQSKNCGDLIKKLDDYLNKHKSVPTSHKVIEDDFKKWLKCGLSDGSARTYIRSIDRIEFHDFLDKQCGIKSGIYSCKDLNAIKNSFEQLLNNNTNESKEANDYGKGNMVSAFRHWIEFFLKENGIRI